MVYTKNLSGIPIKGDLKYGFDRSNKDASILACQKTFFLHPVKNTPVSITAPVPNESLWKAAEN